MIVAVLIWCVYRLVFRLVNIERGYSVGVMSVGKVQTREAGGVQMKVILEAKSKTIGIRINIQSFRFNIQ